jgi:hypothetical protein
MAEDGIKEIFCQNLRKISGEFKHRANFRKLRFRPKKGVKKAGFLRIFFCIQ